MLQVQGALKGKINELEGYLFTIKKRAIRLTSSTPLSNSQAITFLFPETTKNDIGTCQLEFQKKTRLFEEFDKNSLEKRSRTPNWLRGWDEFLYLAVRFINPSIVFETGVFDGQSSAVILQALSDNNNGFLVSVDLPASKSIKWSTHRLAEPALPQDCRPGWAIPNYLRNRHQLVLGDSKSELPQLFKQHPEIDIFFHDSLHTFEHQNFEYTLAWQHLKVKGLLISDDIFWSLAFTKFCREKNKQFVHLTNVHSGGFGAIRK